MLGLALFTTVALKHLERAGGPRWPLRCDRVGGKLAHLLPLLIETLVVRASKHFPTITLCPSPPQ
jgi:hypothetical protein